MEREIKRLMGGSSERETPSKATTKPEAMNIDQTETQRQAQAQVQVQAPTNNSTANARPQRLPERKRSLAPLKLNLWNSDEDD